MMAKPTVTNPTYSDTRDPCTTRLYRSRVRPSSRKGAAAAPLGSPADGCGVRVSGRCRLTSSPSSSMDWFGGWLRHVGKVADERQPCEEEQADDGSLPQQVAERVPPGTAFPVQQGVRRRLLRQPLGGSRGHDTRDPWVEDRVTDVNEEIDDDVGDRDEQRDALDHDVVASVDRVEDGLADPREVEDRLRQDGARQERAEGQADDRHDRQQGRPETMADHHRPLREAAARAVRM